VSFNKINAHIAKKPRTSLKQALLLGNMCIDFIEGHIFKVTLEKNK